MRVAVLQRDPAVRQSIEHVLVSAGYFCTAYRDGPTISKALTHSTMDLLILDWLGTRLFGPELLHSVRRAVGEHLPIMFVSGDASEDSMVRALAGGADDYVALPLRPAEFRARVAALLRRAYPQRLRATASFAIGPYRFDMVRKAATLRGKPMPLSRTQFELAVLFFSNLGRTMSRDHIFVLVWGREPCRSIRTIDSHVSRLRQLLEIGQRNGFRLQPVYKSGYRLFSCEDAATGNVAREAAHDLC
ncbi:response regulator transcription factor [Paraburkholderia susongensis]|uniref:DNA-binding response regulator, OmpR family, contains REC and winged-helix (WHTH) domain n=1 Tax=Paraburkholderia susongensis TaxID=1515439 RepID=A0A1X7LAZ8_9BURK|nr:response regulator transcription factor [Paraburkholderia susongensis]SMG50880.1 DNA-binding response regulator, OmpR family, contains REC and winged-helix (wHTH) domain [Paraburkholderia susongensis]